MQIRSRITLASLLFVAILIAFHSEPNVVAGPPAQKPLPTDEPTKRPYVFPTPIFIPTFVSATDLPSRVTATPVSPVATVVLTGAQNYVVEAGDNPSTIAKKVYGDAGKFRLIVDANNLTDTTRLRAGMTLIIPPLTSTPPTAPPAPAAPAPPTATIVPSEVAAAPEEIETPEPAPESDTAYLARAAQNALLAMSAVLLLGFLAISGTALLLYRRTKREEKIAFIKQRLKGK